jgi:hypothetical protein
MADLEMEGITNDNEIYFLIGVDNDSHDRKQFFGSANKYTGACKKLSERNE